MDAKDVLTKMQETWSDLLSQYYDHVATSYAQHIAKEYNLDETNVIKVVEEHKDKIIQNAPGLKLPTTSAQKEHKVSQKHVYESTSKYGNLSRKELIELSNSRSLPTKRKNQDMVDALDKYDLNIPSNEEVVSDDTSKSSNIINELVPEVVED